MTSPLICGTLSVVDKTMEETFMKFAKSAGTKIEFVDRSSSKSITTPEVFKQVVEFWYHHDFKYSQLFVISQKIW